MLTKEEIRAIRQATMIIVSGELLSGTLQCHKESKSTEGLYTGTYACDIPIDVIGNHDEKFRAILGVCEQSAIWKTICGLLRVGDELSLRIRKDYATGVTGKELGIHVDVIDVEITRTGKSGKAKTMTLRLFIAAHVDGIERIIDPS